VQRQRPPEGCFHSQSPAFWQPSSGTTQGIQIGRHKTRQLMRQAGLKPIWQRKFVHTTDSQHDLPVAAINRTLSAAHAELLLAPRYVYLRR